MWSRTLRVALFAVSGVIAIGCAGTGSANDRGELEAYAPGPPAGQTATPSPSDQTGSGVFLEGVDPERAADGSADANAVGFDVDASRSASAGSILPAGSVEQAGSPPRWIAIPALDVEAEIIDLGLLSDGSLETPVDYGEAGWWAGGPTAGEAGPTVIVGHVDSFEGPAVFFRLSELEVGDEVVVTDAHGSSHRFRVTEVELYDKTDFPTDRVYGDTDDPTLRLVTCGGAFDSRERSYEANWVVFADPI